MPEIDDNELPHHQEILVALIEQAIRDQEAVESSNQELRSAIAFLGQQTNALPQTVSGEVKRMLSSAMKPVASEILQRFDKANEQAEVARKAYQSAARFAIWKVVFTAMLCFIIGIVIFIVVVRIYIPSPRQIEFLRSEKVALQKTISSLEQRGGRADIRQCIVSRGELRPCIRIVDKTCDYKRPNSTGTYCIIYQP